MNKPSRFTIERASETSEALFILSDARPKFRAKIHNFHSVKGVIDFESENPFIQVLRLPIVLEITEIEENYNPNQLKRALSQMANWYYVKEII